MCAFDRSRFKGVSLSKISEGVKEAEQNSKTAKPSTPAGQTKYHQIEEGDNWFKIAPAHDPDDSPYVPIAMSNLECEGDVWKDGEKTGEKEVRNRKVFIATVHSPKDSKGKLIVSKDPVETYLTYLNAKMNEEYSDKEEREKKMAPVRGFRAKDGKWVFGINPDHKIACWAWGADKEIGRLDLSKKQFKDMEKLSLREGADEAIHSDIFVDLEEGYPVVITKTVEKQGSMNKTSYSVALDQPKKRENWEDFFQRVIPTDSQIEQWQAKKPLKDLYVGAYKESDFNMAVDGLQRFDEKWGYGIFEDQEFLNELQEISDMVDKLPTEKTESKKEEKTESKKEVVDEATPIQMKKFLRNYIAENYDEETELPDLNKKELVEWYNLAKAGEELPFDTAEETEEQEEPEEVEADDIESEIANLRKKRKK